MAQGLGLWGSVGETGRVGSRIWHTDSVCSKVGLSVGDIGSICWRLGYIESIGLTVGVAGSIPECWLGIKECRFEGWAYRWCWALDRGSQSGYMDSVGLGVAYTGSKGH